MPAPDKILELVERFDANIHAYKHSTYNETQTRQEFINPFFKALGWDVDNEHGGNVGYKDVIHEDAIKVGTATKAPDYGFYIGSARKFFVEAKKPSVDVKGNIHPAYQLRRYGWSAKLPVSILTDFEEFAVYDCRIEPKKTDKAAHARTLYLTSSEYPERWDDIVTLFSRDAVLSGSFDQYVEAHKVKKGTTEVDVAFLQEIERWRDVLARNLALRNPQLTRRELNFAVQRTIDRIIFLRICEDRGIEEYGKLMALQNGVHVYERMLKLFYDADARYNSGIFHFKQERDHPEPHDTLSPHLQVDDTLLKDILKNIYYPDSPYEFSVLPADILGQVYEQFLGKVIRFTDGHQAKVEEKPEVKKAGGVYYTPTYIVEYIVTHTVGELLTKSTPKKAEKLRILDPACGSGSFLLGAYQYLLDWHREYYVNHTPDRWTKGRNPRLYHSDRGEWKLTIDERKRILLNNVYGVDIDSQAVEVTKLSLLLKVLEGEDEQTISSQMALFQQRVLPDLSKNIKCGNSLIGSDFYIGQQESLLDEEELYRVNTFDWETEFSEIIKTGGFDIVIGNPPYLSIDDVWGKGDLRLKAIKRMYPYIYNDKTDILFYFLGKATQLSQNYISFIVSRAFLEAYKANKLRSYLLENSNITRLIDFRNFYVFPGVGITTCIIILRRGQQPKMIQVHKLLPDNLSSTDLSTLLCDNNTFETVEVEQNALDSSTWTFVSSEISKLNAKIDKIGISLDKVLVIGQGMQTGRNNVFGKRTKEEIEQWQLHPGQYYKRATNSDIQQYFIRDRNEFILYPQSASSFDDLPTGVQAYLKTSEIELKARAAYKRGDCEWWKFTWPLHEEYYKRTRILCPYLAAFNRFALDTEQEFLSLTDTTVLFENNQKESMCYLLGVLNSKVLTFRFKSIGKLKGSGIYEYFWNSISKLPIRAINFSDEYDVQMHDKITDLVDTMMVLKKRKLIATMQTQQQLYQRQVEAVDKQINQLVYQLYELTDEEIVIVEAG